MLREENDEMPDECSQTPPEYEENERPQGSEEADTEEDSQLAFLDLAHTRKEDVPEVILADEMTKTIHHPYLNHRFNLEMHQMCLYHKRSPARPDNQRGDNQCNPIKVFYPENEYACRDSGNITACIV
ncbi:UNVERIFIED_CONTAM: hypothetical protein K2H54_006426 [Gekko kuhli]